MTIIECIAKRAHIAPASTALIYNGRAFSYRQFFDLIRATRAFLKSANLQAETEAAVVVQSLYAAWIVTLAARWLGVTIVVLPDFSVLSEIRLRKLSAVITIDVEQAYVDKLIDYPPGVRRIVIPTRTLAASDNKSKSAENLDAFRGGHICMTSGTTGTPKAVVFHADRDIARSLELTEYYGITDQTHLHALDRALFSASGYKHAVSVWRQGGMVSLSQGPDRYKNLNSPLYTRMHLSPQSLNNIVSESGYDGAPSHCRILIGGGFLDYGKIAEILKSVSTEVYAFFGCTELNLPVFSNLIRKTEDAIWLAPVNMNKLEIVDEQDHSVPDGAEGYLRIRIGENDFSDYLDNATAAARSFRNGFFYTGDMAVQRADKRVKILGRIDDVLVVDGAKVAIQPLEFLVRDELGVNEACLFSRQNNASETELFVVMECDSLPRRECLEIIQNKFFMFRKVHFWPFPALPRTPGGKIARRAVRDFVFQNTAL